MDNQNYSNQGGQAQEIALSRYNEAGLQIMRLHEMWASCENYSTKGRLILWKWELDSIWRELIADVDKNPDKDKIKKKNSLLKEKISKARSRSELYFYLNQRHEFLKIIQDKAGKGGAYHNLDEDGL